MPSLERNENNNTCYFAGNAIFAEKTKSHVMKIDWRFQKTLFGQLVLSILFFWYFANNSFLRPAVDPGTEYFLALLIIVAAAINFWILYPAFQNNNRTSLYFMLTGAEIIILTAVEYIMAIDVKLSMIPIELTYNECLQLRIRLFTNLLFRNCGLMSVVILFAYNNDLKIRIFNKDRRLFRLKKQLLVQSISDKSSYLLDTDKICYIQQLQNYNRFFTSDGKMYERRATLMDILQLLGEEDYLQISKSVIVSKPYIKSCSEDNIVLLDFNVDGIIFDKI